MKVCRNCIMDESDSLISFDSSGQCIYCNNFYENIVPNWHTDERGEKVLEWNARKIKEDGKDRDFDCIMGISGGLDSTYAAYVAKEVMGLRPLLLHVDAGWNTDQAVGNIEKLVDGLGLDLYTEVINWEEVKDLQVSFLRSQVPHQDMVQDAAFFSGLYKFARKYKIKYVLTGGNYSTECIRESEEWGAYPGTDRTFILDIHKKFGSGSLSNFPIIDVFVSKLYYQYFLNMKVFKPLNHIPYIKKDAEAFLEQTFGWKKFKHKHHESRFTRFFEDYWLPRKFGFDRRKPHFSSLILTGQMERDEALIRIMKPELDESFLKHEFEYIAHKLNLTVDELNKIFHGENKTSADYRSKLPLINFAAKVMTLMGLEKRLYQ